MVSQKTKSLGDRMKEYERVAQSHLIRRIPLIIRLDGVAFHSFTKKLNRPYDLRLMNLMQETTFELCKEVHGCKHGYTQSDEISLLLTDYAQLNTEPWFGNNLQKIVSVTASKTTRIFNKLMPKYFFECDMTSLMKRGAEFDSRAFNLSKEEVNNYFLWRQQDATRNAIQLAGQAHFSHKSLHKVNCNQIQEKLFQEKGINFNDYPTIYKRGTCVRKDSIDTWFIDTEIPLFNQNVEYIEGIL